MVNDTHSITLLSTLQPNQFLEIYIQDEAKKSMYDINRKIFHHQADDIRSTIPFHFRVHLMSYVNEAIVI